MDGCYPLPQKKDGWPISRKNTSPGRRPLWWRRRETCVRGLTSSPSPLLDVRTATFSALWLTEAAAQIARIDQEFTFTVNYVLTLCRRGSPSNYVKRYASKENILQGENTRLPGKSRVNITAYKPTKKIKRVREELQSHEVGPDTHTHARTSSFSSSFFE